MPPSSIGASQPHGWIQVLETGQRFPHRSLLFNFLSTIFGAFFITNYPIVDVSGTPRSPATNAGLFNLFAGVGATTNGMVFGTSSSPVDIEDHALVLPISHGVGAGQLQYGSQQLSTVVRVDNSVTATITRAVTNASGGQLNIAEIGAYVTQTGGWQTLIFREVVSAIPVPDGATRTISITFLLSA